MLNESGKLELMSDKTLLWMRVAQSSRKPRISEIEKGLADMSAKFEETVERHAKEKESAHGPEDAQHILEEAWKIWACVKLRRGRYRPTDLLRVGRKLTEITDPIVRLHGHIILSILGPSGPQYLNGHTRDALSILNEHQSYETAIGRL